MLARVLPLMLCLCSVLHAEPLSSRIASYTIDAELDVPGRSISATQTTTFRNTTTSPTDELRFHLYWNAWRNRRSSWMLEDRIRGRSDHGEDPGRDDWGWTRVSGVRLLPSGTPLVTRFSWPDDGNADDRTVFVAELPEPLAPGETVEVELTWESRIPRTFARTGYRGDYFFVAHWFPQLGVLEETGWNCHQFHASTEFFADYGVYDVSLTLPGRFVVGHTGKKVSESDLGDGRVAHRVRAEDVHGFAWAASPDFVERRDRFEHGDLPAVDIRLLLQPEHVSQAERHLAATKATLETYGTWYGPYPYDYLTVVDPAYRSGSRGMEYPTLFTCGTRLMNPPGGDEPEAVTVHETGHQFWYGVVGNNEVEHAWLDEGINTFSTNRTLEAMGSDKVVVRRYLALPGKEKETGLFAVAFPELPASRWTRRTDRLRRAGLLDAPVLPSWLHDPAGGIRVSYDKASLWLETLARHIGWPETRAILAEMYRRHRFAHPRPEAFFAIANEVHGDDLDWFFDQVHYDSVVFDYGVAELTTLSAHQEGWVEQDGQMVHRPAIPVEVADRFRSEAVVRRYGNGRFPVEVLFVFADGHEVRETWGGAEVVKRFVFEREAKLDRVEIDPDHVLMLDTHRLNNTRRREPEEASSLAAARWAAAWLSWYQQLLNTAAFFL